eukprot:NODE_486_length_921_cov_275.810780_g372_i0.p2 GENE.NODE_486_length_921_cov_275.810780_g372_i0~~NODE_486_length_921_cov_275.810780_g372_i0.p2  ORF type:complete len:134 (-),score=33.64 NODE_486_length_921_cov_275.810780_g372_i0:520-888(-)
MGVAEDPTTPQQSPEKMPNCPPSSGTVAAVGSPSTLDLLLSTAQPGLLSRTAVDVSATWSPDTARVKEVDRLRTKQRQRYQRVQDLLELNRHGVPMLGSPDGLPSSELLTTNPLNSLERQFP